FYICLGSLLSTIQGSYVDVAGPSRLAVPLRCPKNIDIELLASPEDADGFIDLTPALNAAEARRRQTDRPSSGQPALDDSPLNRFRHPMARGIPCGSSSAGILEASTHIGVDVLTRHQARRRHTVANEQSLVNAARSSGVFNHQARPQGGAKPGPSSQLPPRQSIQAISQRDPPPNQLARVAMSPLVRRPSLPILGAVRFTNAEDDHPAPYQITSYEPKQRILLRAAKATYALRIAMVNAYPTPAERMDGARAAFDVAEGEFHLPGQDGRSIEWSPNKYRLITDAAWPIRSRVKATAAALVSM
ncbi:hypothetical protein PIIN_11287, partial [Serendipita indica DSM 11827]